MASPPLTTLDKPCQLWYVGYMNNKYITVKDTKAVLRQIERLIPRWGPIPSRARFVNARNEMRTALDVVRCYRRSALRGA